MRTRQTSIQAYREIKENGLLSERRWAVYNTLFHKGPLTASKIATSIPGYKSQSVGFNVHARLCELRSMGVVQEMGQKLCDITNMNVILWDVTKDLPAKIPPRKTKREKKELTLRKLRKLYKVTIEKESKKTIKQIAEMVKEI